MRTEGDLVSSHHDAGRAGSSPPRQLAACLILPVFVLTLAGCAVGPKFVRPATAVQPGWAEQADPKLSTQTPADSAWWTAFND
jgi:hypothetical protein